MNRRIIALFIRRWVMRRRRDVLLQYCRYYYASYVVKTPKRVSILSGSQWMNEMLQGNESAFVENFRMPKVIFRALAHELSTHGGLSNTRHLDVTEQLGIFLFFAGQHASSAQLQQRFQHSALNNEFNPGIAKKALLEMPANVTSDRYQHESEAQLSSRCPDASQRRASVKPALPMSRYASLNPTSVSQNVFQERNAPVRETRHRRHPCSLLVTPTTTLTMNWPSLLMLHMTRV
ncbi:hypothetical protein H257_18567 [Aphanomyces astaci]|uniref:DUF8040 domain-containing protein n=1 Tax=Aphanomyces astaci TaxID=112090 RepID=W4FCY0_APHAT|nr:hypothetical protein H257_18567 [Aphanomyces astaci]ETV64548.1 hypothetical protein H257_18567 [Aphanomyces astaci]|eukprot:XP_009845962.1 hypothetical protein H257_18567 [Aphanomyces astaci]